MRRFLTALPLILFFALPVYATDVDDAFFESLIKGGTWDHLHIEPPFKHRPDWSSDAHYLDEFFQPEVVLRMFSTSAFFVPLWYLGIRRGENGYWVVGVKIDNPFTDEPPADAVVLCERPILDFRAEQIASLWKAMLTDARQGGPPNYVNDPTTYSFSLRLPSGYNLAGSVESPSERAPRTSALVTLGNTLWQFCQQGRPTAVKLKWAIEDLKAQLKGSN